MWLWIWQLVDVCECGAAVTDQLVDRVVDLLKSSSFLPCLMAEANCFPALRKDSYLFHPPPLSNFFHCKSHTYMYIYNTTIVSKLSSRTCTVTTCTGDYLCLENALSNPSCTRFDIIFIRFNYFHPQSSSLALLECGEKTGAYTHTQHLCHVVV